MNPVAVGALVSIGVVIIAAFISYAFSQLNKRQDRTLSKDDAQDTQQERTRLAEALAQKERETAKEVERVRDDAARVLEDIRKERSAASEAALVEIKALIAELDRRHTDEMAEIRTSIAVIEIKQAPFWGVVQNKIIHDLTHPSPQFHEMDELMRGLSDGTITAEGRKRLSYLLDQRIVSADPEVSESERGSAKLMRGVMRKAAEEAENGDD